MNNFYGFESWEWQLGYAFRNDYIYFLLDTDFYQQKTEKAIVTGSFRAWNQEFSQAWMLQKLDKTHFFLAVDRYVVHFSAQTVFKFKIQNKTEFVWLEPVSNAKNIYLGNLCFLPDLPHLRLKAELRNEKCIWVSCENFSKFLNIEDYKLTNSQGEQVLISAILPQSDQELLLVPAENIDIKRLYELQIPQKSLKTFCAYDGWFKNLYSDKQLGANIIDKQKTVFRLFAPRATAVRLYLYQKHDSTEHYEKFDLQTDSQGVWEIEIYKNLDKVYYDYTVHGFAEKGNNFFENRPVHLSDPYARVSVDSWGKSRVWQTGTPAKPLKNGIPKMEDVIAYEVHIQDFTQNLPVSKNLKGTIPAFYEAGLTNDLGQKIGFDYLLDLGINVVHLLPVQEFLHYEDALWKESFEYDEDMKKLGINEEFYEWGYRTTHAFAIETRYRQKNTEFGKQREQLRNLIEAFHEKNIAVIVDIVPNHTAEHIDKQDFIFNFNGIDPQYYYRCKNLIPIGELGNEVKTENRPMVQKWLIDQCLALINEFGIDGFRIDLAGQIDKQTLIALKNAIGSDKILYGEPWIASQDPDYEQNPSWDWYKHNAPITYFQDSSRNAFIGGSEPKEKYIHRGFAGGNANLRPEIELALSKRFWEDKTPIHGINYLDIHDNLTLADRFASHHFDGRFGVEENRFKIAAVLLYTSLGCIVVHGGTEMMRSKALAGDGGKIKRTKNGIPTYLHGKRDTYSVRTPNEFIWENVGKNTSNPEIYCNYDQMFAFWRALNRFRLSEAGKVFRVGQAVPENYFQWIRPQNRNLLGYFIAEKILVLINVGEDDGVFENFYLPQGKWKLIGNISGIDHENGVKDYKNLEILEESSYFSVKMESCSFRIWIKK